MEHSPTSTINIFFRNINRLLTLTNHPKNDSIKDTINWHQIDVLALSEVNIAWQQVPGHTRLSERSAEWFEA